MRLRLPVRPYGRGPVLWLALGAVAVAAVAGTAIAYAGDGAPATVAAATVRVQRGAVEQTASAAGTVQPAQSRGLSFSTGGVVTEVDVKPGDTVTPGQVLARIDGTSAQDEVNTAQASVTSANDALSRAQQTTAAPAAPAASTCQTAAVRTVPAAYVLADSASPSASATASGSASAAPSTSPSATPSTAPTPSATPSAPASPRRTPVPGQPGATTTQPGTGGRSGTGGCTGSTGGTNSGPTGGRSGSSDGLMAAEQQLTNAQLALQLAQDKLAGTTITAPVAGKVLSVAGTVGVQETPGGSGFIVLGEVADTAVRAEFSEADVAHLAVGQVATITLPNRDGAQVTGKVSQIDPAGTASGRLVRYGVLVTFDQVPADLLLGQSANVAVITASATGVLYVPSGAVQAADGSATVTVRSAGREERRTVQVGLRGDQYTEVRSGLQEGDQVVVAGSR